MTNRRGFFWSIVAIMAGGRSAIKAPPVIKPSFTFHECDLSNPDVRAVLAAWMRQSKKLDEAIKNYEAVSSRITYSAAIPNWEVEG